MRLWAVLVVLVYGVMLVVLAGALCLALSWGDWSSIPGVLGEGFCWIWIGALVLGQAVLLFVPVRMTTRRLPPQRSLWVSIVATIFFLWVLGFFAVVNLWFGIAGQNADPGIGPNGSCTMLVGTTLLFWVIWALVFANARNQLGTLAFVRMLMQRLMAGSILELLIAVPSHVVVRQRDECCSPVFTGLGIYTGLAVMLMSFGPGVLILYAQRRRRLLGLEKVCPQCGYDLQATPERCPECGRVMGVMPRTPDC